MLIAWWRPFVAATAIVPPLHSRRNCVKHINIAYKIEEMGYLFWTAGAESARPIPVQFEFVESFTATSSSVTSSNTIRVLRKNSHGRVRHEGIKEEKCHGHI